MVVTPPSSGTEGTAVTVRGRRYTPLGGCIDGGGGGGTSSTTTTVLEGSELHSQNGGLSWQRHHAEISYLPTTVNRIGAVYVWFPVEGVATWYSMSPLHPEHVMFTRVVPSTGSSTENATPGDDLYMRYVYVVGGDGRNPSPSATATKLNIPGALSTVPDGGVDFTTTPTCSWEKTTTMGVSVYVPGGGDASAADRTNCMTMTSETTSLASIRSRVASSTSQRALTVVIPGGRPISVTNCSCVLCNGQLELSPKTTVVFDVGHSILKPASDRELVGMIGVTMGVVATATTWYDASTIGDTWW
eukprot:PhM_4_TR16235/c0_g1_i1/m.98577